MKIELVHGYKRHWRVTELPARLEDLPMLPELDVVVTYTEKLNEGGRLSKAVTLDTAVIPAILEAVNSGPTITRDQRGEIATLLDSLFSSAPSSEAQRLGERVRNAMSLLGF